MAPFRNSKYREQGNNLDTIYPNLVAESWLALVQPAYVELYRVTRVTIGSRTNFALTAQVSRVQLDAWEHLSWFGLRDSCARTERGTGEPAEAPVTASWNKIVTLDDGVLAPLEGNKIVFDRPVPGLAKGQALIVSGKRMRLKLLVDYYPPDASRPALKQGDVLLVLERPSTTTSQGELLVRWHLQTPPGVEPLVEIKPNDTMLVTAAKDDEVVSELW